MFEVGRYYDITMFEYEFERPTQAQYVAAK